MAISQEDIKARIAQIQQAGGGDTAATRAQIAKEAQQYGVTPEQIGTATGLLGSQVRQMAEEAGQAFEPLKLAGGGMLGGTPVDTPTATTVTPQTGMMQGVTLPTPQPFLKSEEFLGDFSSRLNQTPRQQISQAAETGSIEDLGWLYYNTRKSGEKLPVDLVQAIGYSFAPGDKTTAYNTSVGGQAYSEGLDALDKAIQENDVAKATELRNALSNPSTFFDYYNENLADFEGEAHKNLRRETAEGDVFGIGDPGKYVTTWLDQLGDAFMDTVKNPYVQALVAFIPTVGAPISSVMQVAGTLDSGDDPSVAQWAAAIAGVSELAGMPDVNWKDYVPKELQPAVESVESFLDSGLDEATAALKGIQNDLGLSNEQLAAFEDGAKQVLGEENIQAISEGLASFDDARRDLFEGEFADIGNRLGGLEEMFAGLQTEPSGSGFTPQRGYQPGLAVNTDFDLAERSSVLDILNQPSSVRTA